MHYEWDEAKNQKNLAKHGLSFEDAEAVFSGPCVTFEDDRFDDGEERLITPAYCQSVWRSLPIPRVMREHASSR